MSYNSLHQNHPHMDGGSYSTSSAPVWAVNKARKPNHVIHENLENAGNTRFDLRDIMTAYAAAGGRGIVAGRNAGYVGVNQLRACKNRLRNAGPYKLRELHELMKESNMQAPVGNHPTRVPLFYTFERLLQLFFEDYEAIEIPQRIRNWVPAEGSFWNHWWKDR